VHRYHSSANLQPEIRDAQAFQSAARVTF